VVHLKTM